ncbi:MAG: MarR family transcriptional regulator [Bauldia sp.]|uniref:MarR family winged helix-turn-helix transcriptional regulator n=1 Tax=Bauldia sp. TaxID=2575872 RepID=UPI001DE657C4|nr:MarR family transcriptional regulator [Bauldia sp.]MCB1497198.1 MarR family transcriptional regulator [Bauldia sp.]
MDNISPAKHLGMLVHDVSRLMRRQLDQKAQTIGLTSAQWRVLAYLARCEGTNQATLAEYMDMEPITLSRQLDRMEAAGLTERRRDPTDRRAHRLYLTEQARPLIAKFRSLTAGIMNDAVEGISEEEIERLSDSLMRIRNNLTGKDGEPAHLLSTNAPRVAVS